MKLEQAFKVLSSAAMDYVIDIEHFNGTAFALDAVRRSEYALKIAAVGFAVAVTADARKPRKRRKR